MKNFITILLFLFIGIHISYSQIDDCNTFFEEDNTQYALRAGEMYKSSNGNHFPTQGTFRALSIFVNIIYDQTPEKDPLLGSSNGAWTPDVVSSINSPAHRPAYMLNLFDTNVQSSGNYNGVATRIYAESSFNQLILLSDFVVVNIKQSQITPNASGSSFNQAQLKQAVVNYINNTGGLSTCYGHNNISDYDKFTPSGTGLAKPMQADSKIDLVNFLLRNPTDIYGGIKNISGNTGSSNSETIKIGNQFYGSNYTTYQGVSSGDIANDMKSVLTHEYAHLFLGSNEFHTAGGTTNNTSYYNTFIGKQWGYSLFDGGLLSCNGYERWRLGWYGSSNNAYPIASNNVNSDIGKFSGEKTLVLRDFVTYGDAIRIKLPYKDNELSSNQYIWLENHQSGKNNKLDTNKLSRYACIDKGQAGIYAYYQVGKDIIESDERNDIYSIKSPYINSEMDNLRMISAEGNYNVTYEDKLIKDCLGWDIRPRFSYVSPNPLQGVNDQNEVFNHSASASSIVFANMTYLGLKNKNNVLYTNLPYLGDQYDAFVPNPEIKMELSTNPAPVNTTTYYSQRRNSTMTVMPTQRNTRKIYLTGLSIKMIDPQPSSTGMKAYTVKIRWDDYDVKQDVNWTGDIVLKEQLNLLQNKTIVLEQNLTPYQVNKDPVSGCFAPPTKFTCENSSIINLAQNSKIRMKDKSSFILESGATMNIQTGAEIIVEAGSTLRIKAGGKLNVYGNGKITVKPGAYICVEPDANINLQASNSIISIQIGAALGANPALFPNASCASTITFTGLGKVVLPINGKSEIDCKETAFSSNDSLPNATYAWTSSSNIQITTAKNIREIKAKGKSYNTNSWIRLSVTSNGQTYTETKNVKVNIPNNFLLSLGETNETSDGKRTAVITALASPEGTASSCSYNWTADGGEIYSGYTIGKVWEAVHIDTYLWCLMDSVVSKARPLAVKTVNNNTLQVKQVASAASNLSSSKSLLLELSTTSEKGTEIEYVEVKTGGTAATTQYSLPTVNPGLLPPYNLTWDYATLTYTPGTRVTVTCSITGCDRTYSATLVIESYPYSASYVPSSRSIRLTKDRTIPSVGGVQTYQAFLFNDSGYIKTVTFTSNETAVSIPLSGLPPGNYYINVVDAQGNVVERKLIPAN
jgi:hypothetical protein